MYVAPQMLFSSTWNSKNSQHALLTLLESEYTRIKIVHALSGPAISKSILTNYTKGLIPVEKKNVEMYLVVERTYGEVFRILKSTLKCIFLKPTQFFSLSRNSSNWKRLTHNRSESNLRLHGARSSNPK